MGLCLFKEHIEPNLLNAAPISCAGFGCRVFSSVLEIKCILVRDLYIDLPLFSSPFSIFVLVVYNGDDLE